jgi:putative methyltransferase (TIGR04325 family)
VSLEEGLHSAVNRIVRLPGLKTIAARQARRAFIANRDRNMFLGVFETWPQAEAAARGFGQAGYDNSESANLYLTRVRIDRHDYPALHWLYRSMSEGLRKVFDVGGSTGIKYFAFREHLAAWPDLQWTVQDVPAMVAKGRELVAREPGVKNLQFTDRFDDGDGGDVLFASGVLQYLPMSLADLLSGFRNLPKRIVINTAAIHSSRDYFTVNSIGTAFCPYRVQTQATLVRGLTKLGYRLRETWVNPDKPLVIPLDSEHSLKDYSGYVLDLHSVTQQAT